MLLMQSMGCASEEEANLSLVNQGTRSTSVLVTDMYNGYEHEAI